jgi:hypothetical protein
MRPARPSSADQYRCAGPSSARRTSCRGDGTVPRTPPLASAERRAVQVGKGWAASGIGQHQGPARSGFWLALTASAFALDCAPRCRAGSAGPRVAPAEQSVSPATSPSTGRLPQPSSRPFRVRSCFAWSEDGLAHVDVAHPQAGHPRGGVRSS